MFIKSNQNRVEPRQNIPSVITRLNFRTQNDSTSPSSDCVAAYLFRQLKAVVKCAEHHKSLANQTVTFNINWIFPAVW